MKSPHDLFWERMTAFANRINYDEFMGLCLFGYMDSGFYPDKIWFEDGLLIIRMYDAVVDPCMVLLAVFLPEDAAAFSKGYLEGILQKKYPDYEIEIHSIADKESCSGCLGLLYYTKKKTVPPGLIKLKVELEKWVRPLTLLDRLASKSEGTTAEFADRICDFYDKWNDLGELDCFYSRYLYYGFRAVEIYGIDGLRGKWNEQYKVAEAVKSLHISGVHVTLDVWDMDSGFETLKHELKDVLTSDEIVVSRRCLENNNPRAFQFDDCS